MRHLKAGRKLGRNASHRLALMRNLALALFRHERIITTVAKAKEARPFVEKLITLAKRGDLHARRLVLQRLGAPANAVVRPPDPPEDEGDLRKVIVKLFTEIADRFKDRPGGYTRIIKRHERRLGDAGPTAFLELLKEGESKVRAHEPTAPAPRVEEEQPPSETEQESAPAEDQTEQTSEQQEQTPETSAEGEPQQTPAPEGSGQQPSQQEPPKS
jgi:large subunit ribosomal protein L17